MVHRGHRRSDDAGASPLASFTVALGLFSLSFATVMLFLVEVASDDSGINVANAGDAAGAAALVTSSPGTPPTWNAGAPPTRLGLMKAGSTATMDLTKIQALRSWTTQAQYDATRAAMGLPTREVFLRTYPAYTEDAQGNVLGLDTYRAAYVGDYDLSILESTASRVEASTLQNMTVAYTNTLVSRDGVTPGGDKFADSTTYVTRHLAPRLYGVQNTVDIDTLVTGDTYWRVVNISTYRSDAGQPGYLNPGPDKFHVLTTSKWTGAKYEYEAFANPVLSAEDSAILTTLDLRSYGASDRAWFNFTHWASGSLAGIGDPNPALDDYGLVYVRCVETCRVGDTTPRAWGGYHLANGTNLTFRWTSIDLSYYRGEKVEVSLVWHSVNGGGEGEGWFVGQVNATGRRNGALESLWVNNFELDKSAYDLLVVGSDADQIALQPSTDVEKTFPMALRDWVQRGGDLVVFGSQTASNTWLEGTFAFTGTTLKAQGGFKVELSDLSHPVLLTPNAMRVGDWEHDDDTHLLNGHFRNVLVGTTSTGTAVPLLAVSKPNPAFAGVVIDSAFFPWKLSVEARQDHFSNLFVFGKFNDLYTEFGPGTGIPQGSTVSSQGRTVLVDATALGVGVVECDVVVFVW